MDSSTDELPYTIRPSAIFSPGFATTISPTDMASASITSSLPFLITSAVLGVRASNFLIDSVVLLMTLFSRYSPIVNMVNTEADASKNCKSAPANRDI